MLSTSAKFSCALLFVASALCVADAEDGRLNDSAKGSAPNRASLSEVRRLGRQKSRFVQKPGSGLESRSTATTDQPPVANLKTFQNNIRPVLLSKCLDCHGPDHVEANFRIDQLDPDLLSGPDTAWWEEVFGVVTRGEMPPTDAEDMTEEERVQLVDWLSAELQTASVVRRASFSDSNFRRLTKYEYNYALQDLLAVSWDLAKDLPPESTSEDGFRNSAELLHLSVTQFETYRRIARSALQRVIVTGDRPETKFWRISMASAADREWPKQEEQLAALHEQHKDDPSALQDAITKLTETFQQVPDRAHYLNLLNGRRVEADWNYRQAKYAFPPMKKDPQSPTDSPATTVAILPPGRGGKLIFELGDQLPDQGLMRVTAEVSKAKDFGSRLPQLRLFFGWQASNEGRALLKVSSVDTPVTADMDDPQRVQWDVALGEIYPRNSVRGRSRMGSIPSPSEYVRLINSAASSTQVAIHSLKVEAPVYDDWPPKSHLRILGTAQGFANEAERATAVLSNFMPQAWRRAVAVSEVQRKVQLFESIRADCSSFEEAMIEVLAAVLSAPQFLFVSGQSPPVAQTTAEAATSDNAYSLATRLSTFLWCSVPDQQLLTLAESGQLLEPQIAASQVDRMLQDPRSERLATHFVRQWLNLELLEFQDFRQHVRGFDPLLKEAMLQEPIQTFREMLAQNSSVLDFIHCDYAVINERLARHYGLKNVYGNEFRRVPLDEDFRRGGLLTQAGFLAMNSDYPDSHPLKRAVWLLEKVLADPPPPPPPAVPQIDLANPEIAKMTLKERIEDHRNHAACMSCHSRIDPWGIAFENYDALGQWRDSVRGRPVDSTSTLFNNQQLDGMDGLKRFLLQDRQDQFVRAFVTRLTTFALGRPLTFGDRSEIDNITAQVRRNGDGLRTAIHAIVSSQLFQSDSRTQKLGPADSSSN